jgi:uncharacterized protein
VSDPVIFATPADVELLADPINPAWVLDGAPQVRSRRIATASDGASSVMVWSCTAGRFNWYYTVDETLHVVEGEVFVTDEKGDVHRLGPGDAAFFPVGSVSTWTVPQYVRKIAVCRHSMPRPFAYLLRLYNKVIDKLTGFSSGRVQPVRRSAPETSDTAAERSPKARTQASGEDSAELPRAKAA